jgi:hypothetical protein
MTVAMGMIAVAMVVVIVTVMLMMVVMIIGGGGDTAHVLPVYQAQKEMLSLNKRF